MANRGQPQGYSSQLPLLLDVVMNVILVSYMLAELMYATGISCF